MVFARTAFFVLFCLLEEGEGLRKFRSSNRAGAALNFRRTVRILANQFTLGFGAVGLVALPVAFRFFTYGLTLGLGSLAVSYAMRLLAYSDTLRTVKHLTAFIGALDLAGRFLALYVTDGILGLGARSVALWRLTYRVTDRRTVGVVAFPGALRVAGGFQMRSNRNSEHSDNHQSK